MNIVSRPGLLRNLQIGFGLSLLILVITTVASYSSINNLLDGAQWVDHTDSVIIKLDNTLSILRDAESGQRGYLLTGDTSFLRPFNNVQDRIRLMMDSIERMTSDNPRQGNNIKDLREVIFQPLVMLRQIIDKKQAGNIYSLGDLQKGREYMSQARLIIQRMKEEEHRLMVVRIEKVKKYSGYTPVLIVIAAALSIIITLFFYGRVHNDFQVRAALYAELEQKDEDISRRITLISNLADKISEGNYSTRVAEEQKDNLGVLSGSLNKMAVSLEYSFGELSHKEWLQTGIAGLNSEMVEDNDMKSLVSRILSFIVQYTHSQVGAVYLADNNIDGKTLSLTGSYALSQDGKRNTIGVGEGIVGQAALNKEEILLNDIPEGEMHISFASGEIRPKQIIAIPFFFENRLRGVIELGTLQKYTDADRELLKTIMGNVGIAVNTMQNRMKLQELLEETQAQSEELQSQHSELENLNMELEVQAEKLQVSEEELKVQQEELLQTNHELEERSRLLEERNDLIVLRNLDIQKKAEELALSTKYKSEFLANMSHELRTPLNSILLLSRLLAENNEHTLTGEQEEYARVIQHSGYGLLQLIDEILDLSRIESGKMQLEYSVVSLEEILDDMKSLFSPLAKEKGLKLYFIVDENAPAQIETDKMRLEQILKNLLSNAFKFTASGHISLKITQSPLNKNFIDFTVQDTGIGMAADKHQLIFEAFQQADGSTRRKYGGTGLGLSISLQLSRLLGGGISVNSKAGEGSVFVVNIPQFPKDFSLTEGAAVSFPSPILPVTPGTKGSDDEATPANHGLHPASYSEQHSNLYPERLLTLSKIPDEIPDDRNNLVAEDKILLIVEDDTLFAKALLEFSRKKGYKGIVAVRGDAALPMAKKYKPAGILLDIQLPVKSGWEVMDELKKDAQTKHIPVHIMSSFEVKKESLLKGAVDFINKPVAFEMLDTLFQKIEYVLNRKSRKVLIVEDNSKHAKALAYFLANYEVHSEISNTIDQSIAALQKKEVDCVILDMGIPDSKSYDTLDSIKQNKDLANIPIIVFTGKSISRVDEFKIKQYADSIVVKTAHSYQRILDEVSLFLHLVGEKKEEPVHGNVFGKLGALDAVLRNKTVLIADDDVRNIFSLTKALEQHKMKVISAMDGKEALILAQKADSVDIILMDMMMPEMDGYETIARMRRDARLKSVPIIAVTAKAMTGDREKCIQAGASDYISKPVDIDQLISLLRIWLYEK